MASGKNGSWDASTGNKWPGAKSVDWHMGVGMVNGCAPVYTNTQGGVYLFYAYNSKGASMSLGTQPANNVDVYAFLFVCNKEKASGSDDVSNVGLHAAMSVSFPGYDGQAPLTAALKLNGYGYEVTFDRTTTLMSGKMKGDWRADCGDAKITTEFVGGLSPFVMAGKIANGFGSGYLHGITMTKNGTATTAGAHLRHAAPHAGNLNGLICALNGASLDARIINTLSATFFLSKEARKLLLSSSQIR